MIKKGIADLRRALDAKEVSAVEVTQAYLDEMKKMNGDLNAYLSVFEVPAIAAAKESDDRRAKGEVLGVMDGIPLAIKDNILIQGTRTMAGSKLLENYTATNDATVIAKLKAQGAVFLGKTNLDEFSMGSSTEHSAFGPTKNPHDLTRVPGGTSGGSAAAVAADLCAGALGSDTGGSIRQPASFCGVVGMKPTYGRVSRSGAIAMASSLDQIGPMTKTVEDAALLLNVIQGQDILDQTSMATKILSLAKRTDLKGLRIGLPKEAWGDGMKSDVRESVTQAIEVLRSLGAEVKEVSLPYADEALAVYYVLMPCEVSTNLSRFDGIRYGVREQAATLLETYAMTRAHGLGGEARRRILLGTYALSKGYYDAYYRQARKVRTLIRRAYAQVFQEVDVLVTPTAPSTAWRIGEKSNDPLAMYLEDVFTVGVNVAGLPAISIPCGVSDGLPVGMQIIGDRFADDKILDVAYAYEQSRR